MCRICPEIEWGCSDSTEQPRFLSCDPTPVGLESFIGLAFSCEEAYHLLVRFEFFPVFSFLHRD